MTVDPWQAMHSQVANTTCPTCGAAACVGLKLDGKKYSDSFMYPDIKIKSSSMEGA